MKVLAVDYGSRRTGLALGDAQTRVATPLGVIVSADRRRVIDEILKRVDEFEVERIVVGLPLNMDGSRGPACAAVARFVADLRRRVLLPVVLVDEQLSSVAAEALLQEIEGDFRKRKAVLDSVAAQVILQVYFEKP